MPVLLYWKRFPGSKASVSPRTSGLSSATFRRLGELVHVLEARERAHELAFAEASGRLALEVLEDHLVPQPPDRLPEAHARARLDAACVLQELETEAAPAQADRVRRCRRAPLGGSKCGTDPCRVASGRISGSFPID